MPLEAQALTRSSTSLNIRYEVYFFLLMFFSLNDLFSIHILGASINASFILSTLFIPKLLMNRTVSFVDVHKLLRPIYVEYSYLFILMICFGFLFPWGGDGDNLRLWSQNAGGRSVVAITRFLNEIILMTVTFYLIKQGKINFNTLLKILGLVSLVMVMFAVLDYVTGHTLRDVFFSTARSMEGRVTGFSGEPRGFGRGVAIISLILMASYVHNIRIKYHRLYILLALTGVLLSASLSTYTVVFLSLGVLVHRMTLSRKIVGLGFLICLLGIFSFYVANNNQSNHFLHKIESLAQGNWMDKDDDEPMLFTRFEVFDRAALNFLYHNPIYALSGTGPNLISIPASNYLSAYARVIYGSQINSVPHTGFVNVLSRSGVLGLICFFSFFKKLYIAAKKRQNKALVDMLLISFIFFLLIQISFIYVLWGLLLSILLRDKNDA